jgi:hypothetical protein
MHEFHFYVRLPPGPWSLEWQDSMHFDVPVPPGPWSLEHLEESGKEVALIAAEIVKRRRMPPPPAHIGNLLASPETADIELEPTRSDLGDVIDQLSEAGELQRPQTCSECGQQYRVHDVPRDCSSESCPLRG